MKRSVYWMLLCINILLMLEFFIIHTFLYQGRILVILPIIVLIIFICMKECDLEPIDSQFTGGKS